jgi:predicted lysophospholipase L1 biosynthesis ABC-type transport system permease subunit
MAIVGIVPDLKYEGLDADPAPTVYTSFGQSRWWRSMYLVLNAAGDPLAHVDGVRAAVAAVDPAVPVQDISTMERLIGESVAAPRNRAWLLGSFGLLALVLASAGIYGVMSYAVNQRRRETGVRLALGATAGDVTRLVIRDGMRLAVVGLIVGLGLAAIVTRLLSTILFEVSPLDPVTFGSMGVFLATVALLACALPARQAGRTDPMVTLRGE